MKNHLKGLLLSSACALFFFAACKKEKLQQAVIGPEKAKQTMNSTAAYTLGSYQSDHPYNLDVIYFIPNDKTAVANYQNRLSAILLGIQSFYKTNMNNNGYGSKTFGLWTDVNNSASVRILVINGAHPTSYYPYNGGSANVNTEVDAYFAANPSQKSSQHSLILMPTTMNTDGTTVESVPFYGTGTRCFAIDYASFDISHIGKPGSEGSIFTKWYGGIAHEMGHALNLPHSHATKTEQASYGTNLMGAGNYTLGLAPTFINKDGCAILNNCQVFQSSAGTFYNGHTSSVQTLSTSVTGGNFNVYGAFLSTSSVTAVNVLQDNDSQGVDASSGHGWGEANDNYDAIAWSVTPTGNNFSVSMPINEMNVTDYAAPTGNYHLTVELVMANGERQQYSYAYSYANSQPVIPTGFNFVLPGKYTIASSINNAKVLDVTNGYTTDTTKIQIYDSNGSNSQKWQFTTGMVAGYTGYFTLHPQNATSKVMDVRNGYTANGTQIQIYSSNNSAAQQWLPISTGNGYYKLQPGNATSPARVLDLNNWNITNGTILQIYDDNGATAQQWKLMPVN